MDGVMRLHDGEVVDCVQGHVFQAVGATLILRTPSAATRSSPVW